MSSSDDDSVPRVLSHRKKGRSAPSPDVAPAAGGEVVKSKREIGLERLRTNRRAVDFDSSDSDDLYKEETEMEKRARKYFVVEDDVGGYAEASDDDEDDGYYSTDLSEGEEEDMEEEDSKSASRADKTKRLTKPKKQRTPKTKMGVAARAASQTASIGAMFARVGLKNAKEGDQAASIEETNAALQLSESALGDDLLSELLMDSASTKKNPSVAKKRVPPTTLERRKTAVAAPRFSSPARQRVTFSPAVKQENDEEDAYSPPEFEESARMEEIKQEESSEDQPKAAEAPAARPVPSLRAKLLAAAAAPRPQPVPVKAPVVEPVKTTTPASSTPPPPAKPAVELVKPIESPATEVAVRPLAFSSAKIPTHACEANASKTEESDRQAFMMYWMDMWEDRMKAPGQVFVIGRVLTNSEAVLTSNAAPETKSCAVTISNVSRTLYVLPRGATSFKPDGDEEARRAVRDEIYAKIRARMDPSSNGTAEIRSKWVTRSYAFELPNIPRGSAPYLMVQYPMHLETRGFSDPFPMQGETYAHVFGANESAIEHIVLVNKLMGPSWREFRAPTSVEKRGMSHCAFEASLDLGRSGSGLFAPPAAFAQLAAPKISVMSLSLKTVVDPITHHHEIVVATGILHQSVPLDATSAPMRSEDARLAFTMVRPPSKTPMPNGYKPDNNATRVEMSERALLNCVLANLHQFDPDVLLGHNIEGFELDLLISRMIFHKIDAWSKIGRLNLRTPPKAKSGALGRASYMGVLTPGRLVLDTYKVAQELLLGQREYSLSSLCQHQGLLRERREDLDPMVVPSMFKDRNSLRALLAHTAETAQLAMSLAIKLEAVPLTLELTTIGGNLWRRTLGGGRAERIEYLLLHSFYNLDYVVPDKQQSTFNSNAENGNKRKEPAGKKREKAKYSGGLVLEPKVGLYDQFILLLDFNSLYPSIIQEHNICYSTVERPSVTDGDDERGGSGAAAGKRRRLDDDNMDEDDDEDDDEDQHRIEADVEAGSEEVPLPSDDGRGPKGLAVLPRVIKSLVDRRGEVKKQLAVETDLSRKRQLDVRQKALKITANSMYGCLGARHSRFYAKPLASLVTSRGRLILQDTVNIAQGLNFEVVYGDTDSVMVNTRKRPANENMVTPDELKDVKGVADAIQAAVNPKYKFLKLAVDGVFRALLLLKKKKYAALTVDLSSDGKTVVSKRETKGIDLVRRDWCKASRLVGSGALDLILSGKESEDVIQGIRANLLKFAEDARESGKISLEDWKVTKGLNKAPKDYPDAKNQPHLQVALAMIKRNKIVNTGDHIPYIICKQTREAYEAEQAPKVEKDGLAAVVADEENTDKPATTTLNLSSKTSVIAQRAFHPEEIEKSQGKLQVDVDWYLANQILPPLVRLCEPIPGLPSQELARSLGLDPTRFGGHSASRLLDGNDEEEGEAFVDDAERFKDCARFPVYCACGASYSFPGVYWYPEERVAVREAFAAQFPDQKLINLDGLDPTLLLPGTTCPCCLQSLEVAVLSNLSRLFARRAIQEYYAGVLVSDEAPELEARLLPLKTNEIRYAGRKLTLRQKYTAKQLYTQLSYLDSLFDVDRAKRNLTRLNGARRKDGLPEYMSQARSESETENFNALKTQDSGEILKWNRFHWIEPEVFRTAFNLDRAERQRSTAAAR